MSVHVDDVFDVLGPSLIESFGEFPPHEGLQEQTYSSSTLGSRSVESAREVLDYTHNVSKVAKLEDPVEVFKWIIENP